MIIEVFGYRRKNGIDDQDNGTVLVRVSPVSFQFYQSMITLQRCTEYRNPPKAIQASKLYVASRDLVFLSIDSNLQTGFFLLVLD